MPNLFAYFALLAWPIVALVLFRALPLQKALVWTVMGGYLLLPSATHMKIPLIPAFDRVSIVSLSALVLCLFFAPKSKDHPPAGRGLGRIVIITLLATAVFVPALTVSFNTEPLFFGPRHLPGLTPKDAGSLIIQSGLTLVPFWLGLRYLNNHEGHLALLQAFVISGIFYTFPALFEIRMSPQLHVWIYGFFQHDFIQHVRLGGFRPIVFLSHGLLLGIFLCAATLSALTLYKEARRTGATAFGWFFAALWLLLVLYLSKNLGALAIGIALSVFILFTGRRLQMVFAVAVAGVVILYPLVRGAGWFPVDTILEQVEAIDPDRASSLRFRFVNEEALLERANEKPLFGWGSWGRNQIFDPVTGDMRSVTDGAWVIFIGMYGWIGYIALFGLLTLPIVFYALYRRSLGMSFATQGLVLVLCSALIDLIPNSGLVTYVWLMSGGIAGYVLWKPAAAAQSPDKATTRQDTDGLVLAPATQPAPASWLMRPASESSTRRARRNDQPRQT